MESPITNGPKVLCSKHLGVSSASMVSTSSEASYPLSGIKVLDLSRVLAGPYAGRLLSDLGADVLKIEPPEGDLTRKMGVPFDDTSSYFIQQNIGKQNVCIDLKRVGAKELVHELVRGADILIENFRPGVMSRLGLGWDTLQTVNPNLIMLSISGFGQIGPERERGAYAPILHAETGMIARQNAGLDAENRDLALSVGDSCAALHGVIAILAALRHVENGGEGQHIDMSMLNAIHSTDDYANVVIEKAWSLDQQRKFYRFWDAPEGSTLIIAGPVSVLWPLFSEVGELQSLWDENLTEAELEEVRGGKIAEFLLSFETLDDLTSFLDRLSLSWGKVRQPNSEVFEQASIESRNVLVPVRLDNGETIRTVQTPYKFSSLDSGVPRHSAISAKGKDAVKSLSDWLGLSEAEVKKLSDDKIVI